MCTPIKGRIIGAKYVWYQMVTHNGLNTVQFLDAAHRMVVGGSGGRVLREDFCGTGLVSLHWLLLFRKAKVVMVNDTAEPITFGAVLNGWSKGELCRATVFVDDVLNVREPADITCALNCSWCAFLDDETLLKYFRQKRETSSVFVLNLYGGSQACVVNEWSQHGNTGTYVWEHKEWDPATREVKAAMHFYPTYDSELCSDGSNEALHEAFTFHWRLRTAEHTVDLLKQAGFSSVLLWEEASTAEGHGTGTFHPHPIARFSEQSPRWSIMITAA